MLLPPSLPLSKTNSGTRVRCDKSYAAPALTSPGQHKSVTHVRRGKLGKRHDCGPRCAGVQQMQTPEAAP
eukprot:1142540-Pelagomonas_calceolata.AAC.6